MNKKKRAIVIFPQLGSDINLIQDIRDQYDPLAHKIAPYITLVFPFESEISSNELRQHLSNSLYEFKSFNLTIYKFETKVDKITTEIILDDLSSKVEFEIRLK
jgi:predicted  nucleic acid-binding Zn-ribbon protein